MSSFSLDYSFGVGTPCQLGSDIILEISIRGGDCKGFSIVFKGDQNFSPQRSTLNKGAASFVLFSKTRVGAFDGLQPLILFLEDEHREFVEKFTIYWKLADFCGYFYAKPLPNQYHNLLLFGSQAAPDAKNSFFSKLISLIHGREVNNTYLGSEIPFCEKKFEDLHRGFAKNPPKGRFLVSWDVDDSNFSGGEFMLMLYGQIPLGFCEGATSTLQLTYSQNGYEKNSPNCLMFFLSFDSINESDQIFHRVKSFISLASGKGFSCIVIFTLEEGFISSIDDISELRGCVATRLDMDPKMVFPLCKGNTRKATSKLIRFHLDCFVLAAFQKALELAKLQHPPPSRIQDSVKESIKVDAVASCQKDEDYKGLSACISDTKEKLFDKTSDKDQNNQKISNISFETSVSQRKESFFSSSQKQKTSSRTQVEVQVKLQDRIRLFQQGSSFDNDRLKPKEIPQLFPSIAEKKLNFGGRS